MSRLCRAINVTSATPTASSTSKLASSASVLRMAQATSRSRISITWLSFPATTTTLKDRRAYIEYSEHAGGALRHFFVYPVETKCDFPISVISEAYLFEGNPGDRLLASKCRRAIVLRRGSLLPDECPRSFRSRSLEHAPHPNSICECGNAGERHSPPPFRRFLASWPAT